MLNNFTSQALAYIMSIANNETPQEITEVGTELDVIDSLGHALQLFEINSTELTSIANAIQLEKYCKLETLRLAYKLAQPVTPDVKEEMVIALSELVSHEIEGPSFKKCIYRSCVNVILVIHALSEYKDFVNSAIKILNDETIIEPGLFI